MKFSWSDLTEEVWSNIFSFTFSSIQDISEYITFNKNILPVHTARFLLQNLSTEKMHNFLREEYRINSNEFLGILGREKMTVAGSFPIQCLLGVSDLYVDSDIDCYTSPISNGLDSMGIFLINSGYHRIGVYGSEIFMV